MGLLHSDEIGTRRSTSPRRFFLFLAVTTLLAAASLFGLNTLGVASAAADSPTESENAATSSATESGLPAAVIPLPVTLDEEPPAAGWADQINGAFQVAVDKVAAILFKKLFQGTEQSITVEDRSYYVRPAGSKGAFTEIDFRGQKNGKLLTIQQAEALDARGMLETIEGGRVWRKGMSGGQTVEYVTVINNRPTTYVREKSDGEVVFRKKLNKRKLISTAPEDALTVQQAAELAAQGRLQADPSKLDENGKLISEASDPYLVQEPVHGIPIIVIWLATGSVFFTIYMRGFNIWGFRHALTIVGGRYDNPNEPGEVTHFQALSSALSATVGLGNIAGVTIAMTLGGPGAFFWMMACGFFGMSSKFVECTLGQKYRTVKPDGTILGGPMQYLSAGLKELGLGPLGAVLAIVFAVLCILASFGGGNMFQANQAGKQVLSVLQESEILEMETIDSDIKKAATAEEFTKLEALQVKKKTLKDEMEGFKDVFLRTFGLVLAGLVGLVIVGGIKRIGAAAEKIVPTMCGMYILACLYVIAINITEVPALFASIFTEAFSGAAFGGGLVGVLVIGVQRAAFSNEAGVGSAAIAHSAAKTDEPVREGAVALLGPFIDTIVVCSMTALVILITGAWDNDLWLDQGLSGAPLATRAFTDQIAWSWFPWVLTLAIVLFAYSTIVSWSYYGERCWERLFGARTTIVYKALFITAVFFGPMFELEAVLEFSDILILAMAFPNVLGAVLLAPKVKRDLADYWQRYKAGEFKTFK